LGQIWNKVIPFHIPTAGCLRPCAVGFPDQVPFDQGTSAGFSQCATVTGQVTSVYPFSIFSTLPRGFTDRPYRPSVRAPKVCADLAQDHGHATGHVFAPVAARRPSITNAHQSWRTRNVSPARARCEQESLGVAPYSTVLPHDGVLRRATMVLAIDDARRCTPTGPAKHSVRIARYFKLEPRFAANAPSDLARRNRQLTVQV